MLFTTEAHPGLADGSITVTFRTWRRPQAKPGSVHRVGDLRLAIDSVSKVPVRSIEEADARRAGFASRAALVARLAHGLDRLDDNTLVWRVEFHRAPGEEPGRETPPGGFVGIRTRLDRIDRAAAQGPWTITTLRLIAAEPSVVSTVLADEVGQERAAFKRNVRKLKALGLTESLDVGYRLSPAGRAFLDWVDTSEGSG